MSDYLRLVAGDLVRARAIASSAGAGDASKLVMTNGSGVLDASMVSGLIPAKGALDLFTLATMPSPAANTGRLIYVSDAPSNPSVCFSDGTLWRKVSDRSAVYRPGTGPQSMFTGLVHSAIATRTWTVPSIQHGTRFSVSSAGLITAIRHYRTAANPYTTTGRVWTSAGTLLGSVTIPNTSDTGWITATLGTPIEILPGSDYVVSSTSGTALPYIANGLNSERVTGLFTIRSNLTWSCEFNEVNPPTAGNTAPHNWLRDVIFEPYGT